LHDAEVLIDKERIALLKHDAFAFPFETPSSLLESATKKSKKRKNKGITDNDSFPPEMPLDPLPEGALDAAKCLIENEYEVLIENKANSVTVSGIAWTQSQAQELVLSEMLTMKKNDATIYLTDGTRKPKTDKKAMLTNLALEFDTLQEATSALRKKNEKTESKIALLTGGLAKRAEKTTNEILQLYHGLKNAEIEESVYSKLKDQEEQGAVARIDRFRSDIAKLQSDELTLHGIYMQMLAAQSRGQV
jgi:chaperonin cofactor prefoldin